MSSLTVNDDSSVAINIKWLVQIIILVGTAVYLYLGLDNRVTANEDEIRGIRYNRRLVVNGVFWGLGLEVPETADVTPAGDYKPTMYGFKGHKVGLKPDDFILAK